MPEMVVNQIVVPMAQRVRENETKPWQVGPDAKIRLDATIEYINQHSEAFGLRQNPLAFVALIGGYSARNGNQPTDVNAIDDEPLLGKRYLFNQGVPERLVYTVSGAGELMGAVGRLANKPFFMLGDYSETNKLGAVGPREVVMGRLAPCLGKVGVSRSAIECIATYGESELPHEMLLRLATKWQLRNVHDAEDLISVGDRLAANKLTKLLKRDPNKKK